MAKQIIYIIYETDVYRQTGITCVFGDLGRAKSYLKRRAKAWTNDETELKEALEDINKVTDTDLLNDEDFYLQLDDLGVTYYLHREPVL